MTTGWTFKKGNAGDRVDEDTTIYSSTSCLSAIKTGKDTEKAVADLTGVSTEEAAEVMKEHDARNEALMEARAEEEMKLSLLASNMLTGQEQYLAVKKEWNRKCKIYNKASYEEQQKLEPDLNATGEKLSEKLDSWRDAVKAWEKEKQAFDNKWGTSTTSYIQDPPPSPIVKQQEQIDKDLDELNQKINAQVMQLLPAQGLLDWFDAIEQYVDNMPQFSENTSELYEVEQQGTWWVYTGNSAVPDPEFNKKIREFKQRQCEKLNAITDSVTKEVNEWLNGLTQKCSLFMPVINAFKIIQGGVSIDTLVSWGKGVIDFCTGIYDMFYGTYKTVMSIIEILTVRAPQLISKLMNKVMELDCPITYNSIDIKLDTTAIKQPKTKK